MMPEPVLPAVVDLANDLLAPGPAQCYTGLNGEMGVLTFRTPTTTLTIQLPKADIIAWGKMIVSLGESMQGGSALLVATPRTGLIHP